MISDLNLLCFHEYIELELRSVEPQGAHEVGGRDLGRQARPPTSQAPVASPTPTPTPYIVFRGEKNQGRRTHRVLRYGATAKP